MQSKMISTTADLIAFCDAVRHEEFLTLDTEFIRERTYYPQLCLIQAAGDNHFVAIDPLAEGLDLTPFLDLLRNPNQLKVFHAGSQDMEIFFQLMGTVPTPLYDTQIAAMVCGFGEQIGYESLVRELCNGAALDKGSRFTDWAKRPLSDRQIKYALEDVTYLRDVYRALRDRIHAGGRDAWIAEEMAEFADPKKYQADPMEAWRRLKFKSRQPEYLNILRTVAAWRERRAQQRDLPRQRVMRDEIVVQLAALAPESVEDLGELRGGLTGQISNEAQAQLVEEIMAAKLAPKETFPHAPKRSPDVSARASSLLDVMRLLLAQACEEHHVASKLVADKEDLTGLILETLPPDHHLLHGWRYEVFGHLAVDLLQGRVSLCAEKTRHGYQLAIRKPIQGLPGPI
jgi:ribonuclease D